MPKILTLLIRMFRITVLGLWIIATVPLLALFRLVGSFVLAGDKWLGQDDPEILSRPWSRIFWIVVIGTWIFATNAIEAVFKLVFVSVDRVDHWLGIEDPEILGEPVEPPQSKYR